MITGINNPQNIQCQIQSSNSTQPRITQSQPWIFPREGSPSNSPCNSLTSCPIHIKKGHQHERRGFCNWQSDFPALSPLLYSHPGFRPVQPRRESPDQSDKDWSSPRSSEAFVTITVRSTAFSHSGSHSGRGEQASEDPASVLTFPHKLQQVLVPLCFLIPNL